MRGVHVCARAADAKLARLGTSRASTPTAARWVTSHWNAGRWSGWAHTGGWAGTVEWGCHQNCDPRNWNPDTTQENSATAAYAQRWLTGICVYIHSWLTIIDFLASRHGWGSSVKSFLGLLVDMHGAAHGTSTLKSFVVESHLLECNTCARKSTYNGRITTIAPKYNSM
jgi:hypothetical protein